MLDNNVIVMSANALGVIAAVVLLASFVLRGEKKIRAVNLVGCVFLILWGAKMSPANIILVLLGVATILIHCVQFWNMFKEARGRRAVAKAEARAAELLSQRDTDGKEE